MKKTRVTLSFPPEIVEEPVVYRVITQYGLMVNILRASIDPGKQGRMVVEISGPDDSQLSMGLNYIERAGVTIEPLARQIRHLEDLCTSCTACVPICPTGALEVDRLQWKVTFDHDKCVVCLSCLDVCPYRAIETSIL